MAVRPTGTPARWSKEMRHKAEGPAMSADMPALSPDTGAALFLWPLDTSISPFNGTVSAKPIRIRQITAGSPVTRTDLPRLALQPFLEIPRPRNTKPAQRAGSVCRQSGEYRDVTIPIFSENLNRRKLFLSHGDALPEIVTPSDRVSPRKEALCL
jgi:hypothetical protein